MQFNWIDWIIIAVIVYHVAHGWKQGFLTVVTNFVSFLASLWVAIRYNALVGVFLTEKFGIASAWATTLGYVILAFPTEILTSTVIHIFMKRVSVSIIRSVLNRLLGSLFAATNGAILASFLLVVVLTLPLRGTVKRDVKDSRLAMAFVTLARRYGGSFTSSVDTISQQALQFITVKPQSLERLSLDIAPTQLTLTIDADSESGMVKRVNGERAAAGLPELRVDAALTDLARSHSRDMFQRRYFSHVSPEGHDIGYRAQRAGVSYSQIGENLAYAPDVTTAHAGLMNSEGHRNNILDPTWTRTGIGVIDGDSYGKMFTQVFAN